MASAARKRAVLFADLVGSTRLYDKLGDREAYVIASGCLLGIRQTVERFGGIVIKTIGDEVMATFASADAACDCAAAIVSGMRCTALGSAKSLGVHVGFAFGPVIEKKRDVFGDTVNVAAHLVSLADNQRIFTTAETAAEIGGGLCERLRFVERVTIKGRADPIDIFELTTGYETLLRFVDAPRAEDVRADSAALIVSCRGKQHVVRDPRRTLTIGRDKSNDLVLTSPSASRFHAQIEWRKQAFYLVDRSSNGTLVIDEHGRATVIHREGLRIDGSGTFGIANARSARPEEPIRFELRGVEAARKSNPGAGE
ncbi:MAG: adenylate/guanylate cyclase domain-containing protein [Myxococcales bacterium]|nr:adenylate/guanylate cyclase domain-containing protein [Myxococcales bacterium]MDH5565810.1 adenylate/guanylate cyclase domain-containing protein [Myxococcales bacterium]